MTDFGAIDSHGFFLPGSPPSDMFYACTTQDFICLLPPLSTLCEEHPTPVAADTILNQSGCCYCWIFVLHFTSSLLKGGKTCEGHSLLQLAAEILPTLKHYFMSVCNCTHKVVYTKSELKMSPRHDWRFWMQEIRSQNVRVQLMACLNVLLSLKGLTAGVNFYIRYHSLLQIFPCDWFWLKKAFC